MKPAIRMMRWIRQRAIPALLLLLALGADRSRAADFSVRRNVVYGEADGQKLLLDVRSPPGRGPFPVAILVHGGGWNAGSKSGRITPWFEPLAADEVLTFAIDYRVAPKFPWPACYDDLKTAVRWVKAHAKEYQGDPTRIAVFGHSAGGHLVCLLGTDKDPAVRVQAVVGFAAIPDLLAAAQAHRLGPSFHDLFGIGADLDERSRAVLKAASPIDHLSPNLPPLLLLQGTADQSVDPAWAAAYQAAVRHAGSPADLILIPGAPHVLTEWLKFDPEFMAKVTPWLNRVLNHRLPKPTQS